MIMSDFDDAGQYYADKSCYEQEQKAKTSTTAKRIKELEHQNVSLKAELKKYKDAEKEGRLHILPCTSDRAIGIYTDLINQFKGNELESFIEDVQTINLLKLTLEVKHESF